MGRNASGVRNHDAGKTARHPSHGAGGEEQQPLTATESGFGKRTQIIEYTRHGRGTKGMIAIQQSARNGKVVAMPHRSTWGTKSDADHHGRCVDPHFGQVPIRESGAQRRASR